MKFLAAGLQHRAVDLAQPVRDVDDAGRVDAHQVALGQVMDRARREAVDDCGDARGLDIGTMALW